VQTELEEFQRAYGAVHVQDSVPLRDSIGKWDDADDGDQQKTSKRHLLTEHCIKSSYIKP